MMFLTCLFTVLVITNFVLWFLYRFGLIEALKAKDHQLELACTVNRNLMTYIDELQERCEQLRRANVREMLANKMTTNPAYILHPLQPGDSDHFIATHLN